MFRDRQDAGKKLAQQALDDIGLRQIDRNKMLVLSIPAGGAVVGAAIAEVFGCAHEVLVVHRIGFQGYDRFVLGAAAEGGMVVINDQLVGKIAQVGNYLEQAIKRTQARVETDVKLFRQGRAINLQGKTVLLVDEGIVSSETMRAAIQWINSGRGFERPERIMVAVPVCTMEVAVEIDSLTDGIICPLTVDDIFSLRSFYEDFAPVSNETVVNLLGGTLQRALP